MQSVNESFMTVWIGIVCAFTVWYIMAWNIEPYSHWVHDHLGAVVLLGVVLGGMVVSWLAANAVDPGELQ